MITDRISLNLAYIYLSKFQSNEGPISDILLWKTLYDYPGTKLETRFSSLSDFKTWIDQVAPMKSFIDLECFPLAIYELMSFTVTKTIYGVDSTTSNKNVVSNDNRLFKTNSDNINTASLLLFNDTKESYMKFFKDLLKEFNELKLDEYILIQREYIDCKYIEVYFEKSLAALEALYIQYKNRN